MSYRWMVHQIEIRNNSFNLVQRVLSINGYSYVFAVAASSVTSRTSFYYDGDFSSMVIFYHKLAAAIPIP